MSATSVKLLKAAAELVGGTQELALRLGIGESMLSRYIGDESELPDGLLLRVVDIIFDDRNPRMPPLARLEAGSREGTP